MDLQGQFETWLELVRAKFETGGAYPLIDTRCLPQEDLWNWYLDSDLRDSVYGLLESAIVRNPGESCVRFLALNLYYELTQIAEEQEEALEDNGVFYQPGRPIASAEGTQTLSHFVSLREVRDCVDLRTIRWEIVNFAVVRRWDAVLKLFAQIERNRLMEEAPLLAVRGQFLLARALFAPEDYFPELWEPTFKSAFHLFPFQQLALICTCLALPASPEQPVGDQLNALRDAANDLEKALSAVPDLPVIYHLMAAAAEFGRGDFLNAANHYQHWLQKKVPWVAADLDRMLKGGAFRALAVAHQRAGHSSKALPVLEEWIQHDPKQIEPVSRLAALHRESADYFAAAETYRAFYERNPGIRPDEKTDLILALGPLASPSEAGRRAAKAIREDPAYLQLVKALVGHHWREFGALPNESQDDWAIGESFLQDEVRFGVLGAIRYSEAITSFGVTLERELKRLIFRPFATAMHQIGTGGPSPEKGEDSGAMGYFAKFVRDPDRAYLALGQMCVVLKRALSGSAGLGAHLGNWLGKQKIPILSWIDAKQLTRLAELRGPTGHPARRQLSAKDAAEFAGLAKRILSCLYPATKAA